MKIPEWSLEEAKWKNAYQFYERKSDFRDYYFWYYEDVIRVMRGYPHITFRYLVSPSQTLPSEYFPIYSNSDIIEFQINLGEKDTEQAIKDAKFYNGTNAHKLWESFPH